MRIVTASAPVTVIDDLSTGRWANIAHLEDDASFRSIIASADDVLEFISAGATAVQVGSQTLVDPTATRTIVETLPAVMEAYGIESLDSIQGRTLK